MKRALTLLGLVTAMVLGPVAAASAMTCWTLSGSIPTARAAASSGWSGWTEVTALVEKPAKRTAPSNLMIPGRYILQPEVMAVLDNPVTGAGGEIQLTDAMAQLIGRQPFHGYTFDGQRYDCGDKAGYIQANLALALAREDIGPAVREFARGLLG